MLCQWDSHNLRVHRVSVKKWGNHWVKRIFYCHATRLAVNREKTHLAVSFTRNSGGNGLALFFRRMQIFMPVPF